jgi:hypothetical protein
MKPLNAILGMLMLAPCASAMAFELPPCCASGGNGRPNAVAVSSSDLGKVSPSGQNLSLSPEYQVFQFTRSGVRYTEVADASGSPRAAFTFIGGELLALPVGDDAVQQIAIAPTSTDVVYADATMVVARHVGVDGAVSWQVYAK